MRKKGPASSRSLSQVAVASPPRASAAVAPESDEARGVLVVVELGGEWPTVEAAEASSSRRVLAQVEGESPMAFAERVANGLDGLFSRGIRLETIVMACNERLDDAAEAARRKVLGFSLGSMAKHKSGRAYLAASARSGGRLRHALAALAQGLFDEWRTAGLEVSVDFGEDSRLTATPPFAFTARVA